MAALALGVLHADATAFDLLAAETMEDSALHRSRAASFRKYAPIKFVHSVVGVAVVLERDEGEAS